MSARDGNILRVAVRQAVTIAGLLCLVKGHPFFIRFSSDSSGQFVAADAPPHLLPK